MKVLLTECTHVRDMYAYGTLILLPYVAGEENQTLKCKKSLHFYISFTKTFGTGENETSAWHIYWNCFCLRSAHQFGLLVATIDTCPSPSPEAIEG